VCPGVGRMWPNKVLMDWDNITQTGARATGVEEGTLRMVVHHKPILDSERGLKGLGPMHEGQRQSKTNR
jgi:hypothetical protein